MLTFATAKVGGIRFVRIGRLAISICVVRKGRPHTRRVQPGRVTIPCTITLVPERDYSATEARSCE